MANYSPINIEELYDIPAFHSLSMEQVKSLATYMVKRTYDPGQIIFMEGEKSGWLWFVLEGQVKIIKQSLNGRVQGLCLINRGKCFGSCPLFDMEKNPATAQAMDFVTLVILSEKALHQLKERDPQMVTALLHIYSQRLGHLARVSEVLGSWGVHDRINDCLLTYANRSSHPTTVQMTHEKLASLAGTVREVVTRHIGLLEKEGVVRNEPGRIILLKPDELLPSCAFEEQRANV